MTRTKKILSGVLLALVVGVGAFAFAVSRDAPCPASPALAEGAQQMQAVVARCYGAPDVLRLENVETPVPGDDQILVRVRAAAVNPLDWHFMRGQPYIVRLDAGFGAPQDVRMGVDFAGVVEAVGSKVQRFKPGDEVFGGASGAFAEFVRVREQGAVALKPANVSFEEAAAVPVAAVTALQALRDRGRVGPGQKVLINGASGGVGTYAVQLAKHFGAEVTGVCSTRNVELVRSLGADHVIDYKRENFTAGTQQYDVIVDNVGNHGINDLRRVLTPEGILVIVGGPDGKWLGPLMGPIKAAFVSPFVSQELGLMIAQLNSRDLEMLAGLMQSGELRSVIDRRYPLSEVPAAVEYLETGRARGKVIIMLSPARALPDPLMPTAHRAPAVAHDPRRSHPPVSWPLQSPGRAGHAAQPAGPPA